jgi:hypothetical protein
MTRLHSALVAGRTTGVNKVLVKEGHFCLLLNNAAQMLVRRRTTSTDLVFRASKHLKITVDVGFVVGTMPAMMPMGSATFWMPSCRIKTIPLVSWRKPSFAHFLKHVDNLNAPKAHAEPC